VRHLIGTSGDREPSAQLTDRALRAEVSRKARCAGSTLNPDEWFPVSTEAETARREAAAAIAIFTACPVRGAWLELALSRSRGGGSLCRRRLGTAGCGAGHRVRGLSMLHGLPVSCSGWPVCMAVARTATASSIPRAAVAVSGIA
jgi:hypothetical protein